MLMFLTDQPLETVKYLKSIKTVLESYDKPVPVFLNVIRS